MNKIYQYSVLHAPRDTHRGKNNSLNPLWAKQACRHTKQYKSRQRQSCFSSGPRVPLRVVSVCIAELEWPCLQKHTALHCPAVHASWTLAKWGSSKHPECLIFSPFAVFCSPHPQAFSLHTVASASLAQWLPCSVVCKDRHAFKISMLWGVQHSNILSKYLGKFT